MQASQKAAGSGRKRHVSQNERTQPIAIRLSSTSKITEPTELRNLESSDVKKPVKANRASVHRIDTHHGLLG